MAYEGYNAFLSVNSSSNKERMIYHNRQVYSATFDMSPSYEEVYFNDSIEPTGVQIVDDSKNREQKLLLSLDLSYDFGTLIKWNNETWLTVIVDNMGGIYKRGIIKKCISTLKWLDDEGFEHECPFTYKGETGSSFGIHDGRIISVGNERRSLVVHSSVDTLNIKKNQRFIFDSRVWRAVSIDTISQTKIVNITVEEDNFNAATDNLDLRIADYFGKSVNYTIEILNGANFSMQAGKTLELKVDIMNRGEIVDKEVIFTSSDDSVATVDANGLVTSHANGTVTIFAAIKEYPEVSISIIGTVEFIPVNNYSITLDVEEPEVIVGTSETFTVRIYNNGVLQPSRYVYWYFYSDDKASDIPTTVKVTLNSSTQFTLKVDKSATGYIQVKAVLVGEIGIEEWFRVKLDRLI